jgi:hypothetical protein
LARDALQASPAAALFLLSSLAVGRLDGGASYDGSLGRFGDLSMLIDFGQNWRGALFLIAYAACLGGAVAAGWLRPDRRVLPIMALLFAVFLFLPVGLFETDYVPWRAMLALLLIGVSALRPGPRLPQNFLPAMLALVLGAAIAYPVWHAASWRRSSREERDFLSAIQSLRPGSKIFFAHDGALAADLTDREDGAYHVASYAVIAHDDLVQSLFVYPGQQILRYRAPALQDAPRNSETMLSDIVKRFRSAGLDLRRHVLSFDDVVIHGEDQALEREALPLDHLRLIAQVGSYRVFAVDRPAPRA